MLRCILVDDEPLARERFRALLAKAEADVEIIGEAENGKQAVPMIYEQKPDLVFLDIQMPSDAVKELVPCFNGTYCIRLEGGTQLPVARRRSASVKSLFGKG